MACEHCLTGQPVRFRTDSGIEMEFDLYCPYCGAYLPEMRFISKGLNLLKELTKEYVEIDGEVLEVERIKSDAKPMDMKMDLSKVDITRELKLLENWAKKKNGEVEE